MSADDRFTACMNLTRRMPPSTIEQTLGDLMYLADDLTEKLLQHIEVPLKTETDTTVGRDFIICDYNRDGDSYRSPYSNQYFPPLEEGLLPSDKLRSLEIEANGLFEKYLQVYYEGGYSSVYAWESGEGMAACVLLKKDYDSRETHQKGTWNSSHFFKITKSTTDSSAYDFRLTTAISLSLGISPVDLSGNLTRKFEKLGVHATTPAQQAKTMGMMVEESENQMRSHIETVYFGRVKGIVSDLRSVQELRFKASTKMVLPIGESPSSDPLS
ncbi:F-actin-capping protein subunit beta [Monocercomonoides exilis]|uniref:F-actin-capping protein subunit beta n=1 Tax=Monocercomonoides exilis TaxID=2049356 RepID=UPI0035596E92|nr:F-actin-capping protein subunit beta [Monocercomonoides exilis]|eukprot:MONOS_10646.1-p1 / transcript=MONOS_10646.1 / gene=MONOS_10646 / organism=Monocercomonoides_exilis_PA203 / gene_product=F-actin-capping protein subunit beta / transcript_product=F-actin-capping protein subunit beta / location=Mono_scaffold00492:18635-19749(+) / protein_length=271 / sequence_SO=supercontig / SO=protein_coding / is_pseudo=false